MILLSKHKQIKMYWSRKWHPANYQIGHCWRRAHSDQQWWERKSLLHVFSVICLLFKGHYNSRSSPKKELNAEKSVHNYSLWLAIFSWASVPILDFHDQQEKFMTSASCVTKLTLHVAAKAAFIRKILCFELFKILFGQLVDRILWPYWSGMVPCLLS